MFKNITYIHWYFSFCCKNHKILFLLKRNNLKNRLNLTVWKICGMFQEFIADIYCQKVFLNFKINPSVNTDIRNTSF